MSSSLLSSGPPNPLRPAGFSLQPKIVPRGFLAQEDLDERPDGSRDKAFEESKRAAFKRQSLTCVGCGNPDVARADLASGISHVFYASFDRTDTSAGNLYPACPICNDILTVGYAVDHHRGEFLIGRGIAAEGLVNIARALLVAKHRQGRFAEVAVAMRKDLSEALWASTREVMPDDYDGSPKALGYLMQSDMFASTVTDAELALSPIVYLPFLDTYPEAASYWSSTQYSPVPDNQWARYRA